MDKTLKEMIAKDLGLTKESPLNESYVTAAKKYDVTTELLSKKNIDAHNELLAKYVDDLNNVSAKLDTVSREDANLNHSEFRSLKIDETYNLNAAYLHALFFENIGDPNSTVTMDSITFLRIERDFGSFDAWQKDFIACALSARNGWAVTVYNEFLGRYMNVVVDLHSLNVPFASQPVIVLDCWEHSYYRDYLKDRKTYIYAMMKEFDWTQIETRVKKAEKIAKILGR